MQILPKTLLKTVFCHTLLPQYLRSRGKKLSNLLLLCIAIRLLFSPIIAFNLKGLTVNVRGLNKPIKRRALFRWLHKQNKDFIFLQETYSSDEIAKIWETERGGKVLFNHGTNHSKGVMILFNPKFDCTIEKITRDKNGRFTIAKVTIDDSHLILANIYSPNDVNQQVHFFKELQDQLQEYPHENIIIGGDFNCALTPRDKEGGNPVTRKLPVIIEINRLCNLYNLCDIWRSLNPDVKQFTWRDKSFKVQCRLDYFFSSNELSNLASDCSIIYAPKSDHSAAQINLIAEEFKQKKGPGFWKFNTSFLEDHQYVTELRENLPEFKSKYQSVEDLGLRWDLIKMEIRGFTPKLKHGKDGMKKKPFKIK